MAFLLVEKEQQQTHLHAVIMFRSAGSSRRARAAAATPDVRQRLCPRVTFGI